MRVLYTNAALPENLLAQNVKQEQQTFFWTDTEIYLRQCLFYLILKGL